MKVTGRSTCDATDCCSAHDDLFESRRSSDDQGLTEKSNQPTTSLTLWELDQPQVARIPARTIYDSMDWIQLIESLVECETGKLGGTLSRVRLARAQANHFGQVLE
jgi:hypothetical protein